LVLAGGLVYGLQQLLFGPLRAAEVEQLWERGWFAVMEWVFAMSTFRDEFGIWFLVMFLSLFSGKVWGWIAEGRVEQLEQQPPENVRLLQPRLLASLGIYLLFAVQMFMYSLDIVLYEARPGMTVMFLFEFAILWICAVSTCLRYVIWVQEHRILKKQMAHALETRKAEIRTARQEAEARIAAGTTQEDETPLDELPSEDDIDESEIDVPGWDAKRGWVFVLDITTGRLLTCSVHVLY
jgi:E3 ubiquitin-protein ligase synoviolin